MRSNTCKDDGPKGSLSFVRRLNPQNFKAAFTAAEGWGSLEQKRMANEQVSAMTVQAGKVRLTSVS